MQSQERFFEANVQSCEWRECFPLGKNDSIFASYVLFEANHECNDFQTRILHSLDQFFSPFDIESELNRFKNLLCLSKRDQKLILGSN